MNGDVQRSVSAGGTRGRRPRLVGVPLVPGKKTPAIRGWEQRATVDRRQIHRWWAGESCYNIGVATGKSGLVVIDLDGGRGDRPPEQFAGAHDGHDVLAMLADAAGAEMPSRTYTVTTPSGCHLYFRTPSGISFRNSAGLLGWRVDSRASGGYVVAAGSVREQGAYTVARPVSGFCAETGGALAITLASHYGIPVSTTHTIPARLSAWGRPRVSAVRWGIARRIVWAWLVTIPAAGLMAALAYILRFVVRS